MQHSASKLAVSFGKRLQKELRKELRKELQKA